MSLSTSNSKWSLSLLLLLSCLGCARARPDFGTLPRVIVELDDPPPPKEPPVKKAAPPKAKPVTSDQPDPPPLVTREQYDFKLLFDKGTVSVKSHKTLSLKLKTPTVRRVGRFAFELWSGPMLIERVRFDFPLLGAGAPEGDDPLEKGLTTQTTVRVPYSTRANRAQILDRKTRALVEVPWPPLKNSTPAPAQTAEPEKGETPLSK